MTSQTPHSHMPLDLLAAARAARLVGCVGSAAGLGAAGCAGRLTLTPPNVTEPVEEAEKAEEKLNGALPLPAEEEMEGAEAAAGAKVHAGGCFAVWLGTGGNESVDGGAKSEEAPLELSEDAGWEPKEKTGAAASVEKEKGGREKGRGAAAAAAGRAAAAFSSETEGGAGRGAGSDLGADAAEGSGMREAAVMAVGSGCVSVLMTRAEASLMLGWLQMKWNRCRRASVVSRTSRGKGASASAPFAVASVSAVDRRLVSSSAAPMAKVSFQSASLGMTTRPASLSSSNGTGRPPPPAPCAAGSSPIKHSSPVRLDQGSAHLQAGTDSRP